MERIHVAVRPPGRSPRRTRGALSTQRSTCFEFVRIFGEGCRTAAVYIADSAVRGFNGTAGEEELVFDYFTPTDVGGGNE
ncbi:kinesin-like protein KIN-7I [Phragmites australis]|uniref:kinesin-like protein KIN-7I n=1 Tax=Phragmites australis TaxID=29695 RepID=UPI002D79C052|nr:kinesin-like protein KIN-7I [Phragmites australis]